jgi:hypothetical protein
MGKKCGVDVRPPGAAIRAAEALGAPRPGDVTAPSETPTGRRKLRETIETLQNLRKQSGAPQTPKVSRIVTPTGSKRAASETGWGLEPVPEWVPDSPEPYVPESQTPESSSMTVHVTLEVTMLGVDEATIRRTTSDINANVPSEECASAIDRMKVQYSDEDVIKTLSTRETNNGVLRYGTSKRLTGVGRVAIAAANRLLRHDRAWLPYIKKAINEGGLEEWIIGARGFMQSGVELDGELARVRRLVGEVDVEGEQVLTEEQLASIQEAVSERLTRRRRLRSDGPAETVGLSYKGRGK